MNNYCGIGNLTRDPVLKTTPTGKSVCRFTIAVNGIKKRDSDQQRVDYIPCVAWDSNAENLVKYMKKGNMIAIKGSLRSGKYEKNGQILYTMEVELDKYDGLKFLSNGNKEKTETGGEQTAIAETAEMSSGFTAVETDELPF